MKYQKVELTTDDENKKTNNTAKRIIGIEILRMFLCFRIVVLHYYTSNNKFLLKLKEHQFQVPCFFLISFYFLYKIILRKDYQKLKLRLERLLVPYIIYPIFVWIINNLIFLITKFNRFNRLLTLNELKLNLIVGKGIFGIGILWFHFNLIILTLLFFIFSVLLEKYFLLLFQFIGLFALLIQYSEINFKYFNQYNINISMSVGNLIETLTMAIFAFSIADANIILFLSKKGIINSLFSCFFLFLIYYYNIFSPLYGFSSSGIKQIIVSFCLFNIFYIIKFDLFNSKTIVLVQQMTKYTQGIYCLHFLIQYYLKLLFDKNGTFIGCFILSLFP